MKPQYILQNIPELSSENTSDYNSFPSLIVLNANTPNNEQSFGSAAISDLGTIGNLSSEYALEFFNINTHNSSFDIATDENFPYKQLKKLFLRYQQETYLTFTRDELTKLFTIIEIPEYAFQEMTAANYDIILKLFDTNGNFINPISYCLLRSYTSKKIYILLDDKEGVSLNSRVRLSIKRAPKALKHFNIILNFRQRWIDRDFAISGTVSDEKLTHNSGNLYTIYSRLNQLSNIDSPLGNALNDIGDFKLSSPYYDDYRFDPVDLVDNIDNSKISLDKQENYFNFLADENIYDTKTENSPKLNSKNISITSYTLRENPSIPNKLNYIIYSSNTSNVKNNYSQSFSYEVYGLSSKTAPTGARCFLDTDLEKYSYFIIYAKCVDSVHYIINLVPGSTLTFSELKGYMQEKHLYLYNSDFTENDVSIWSNDGIFKGIIGNTPGDKVEIYLNIERSGEISDTTSYTFDGSKFLTTTFKYKSEISQFDPSALSEVNFYTKNPQDYLPYFEQDSLVDSILTDTEIELKVNDTFDNGQQIKLFDIITAEEDDLKDKEFDILPRSQNIKSEDDINIYEDLKTKLNSLGYRNYASENLSELKINISKVSENEILSKNLEKLIPDNAVFSTAVKNSTYTSYYTIPINNKNSLSCLGVAITGINPQPSANDYSGNYLVYFESSIDNKIYQYPHPVNKENLIDGRLIVIPSSITKNILIKASNANNLKYYYIGRL